MKKTVFMITTLLTISSFHLTLKTNYQRPHHYRNNPLTPENVIELAPAVPTEINQTLKQWFLENPSIIQILSGIDGYLVSPDFPEAPYLCGDIGTRIYHSHAKSWLQWLGYRTDNRSNNWVLPITTDNEWFIKSIGLPNRLKSIYDRIDKKLHDNLTTADLIRYVAVYKGTFGLISRMAYYLRMQEIIDKEGLSLKLPEAYLIHLPGRPTIGRDENYVILERSIGQSFHYLEQTELAFNEKIIGDLILLIAYTGINNCKETIAVSENNQVYILDQTSNHIIYPPFFSRFFHRNTNTYEQDIMEGITSLYNDIVAEYAKKSESAIPSTIKETFERFQGILKSRFTQENESTNNNDISTIEKNITDFQETIDTLATIHNEENVTVSTQPATPEEPC